MTTIVHLAALCPQAPPKDAPVNAVGPAHAFEAARTGRRSVYGPEASPTAKGPSGHLERPIPVPDALGDAGRRRDPGPAPATSFEVGGRRARDELARPRRKGRLDARELA